MPPKKKKATPSETTSVPVESLTHPTDTRTNIPTRETAEFATTEAASPRKVLYPRDSSLDPQLVWKGKDEQDAKPFEVPAPPIYVQEKIHPRFIIDDLKARVNANKPKVVDLFSDFNGLDDFQKKLDFYQHDQHWTNRLILGDSLLVMNSLAERERLRGRVQCIYFDPPYGIKFGSNWQVSTRKRDVKDAKAEDLTRQPEQIKAFRDTWELGIHSYLTYLRDRLTIARDLLTESGSIFVQIGDENVHLVRSLMDEVFGSDNFVSLIPFKKTGSSGSELLDNVADFILWYSKTKNQVKYRALFQERKPGETLFDAYSSTDAFGKKYQAAPLTSSRPAQEGDVKIFNYNSKNYSPGSGTFKTDMSGLVRLANAGRLLETKNSLRYKRYLEDFPVAPYSNFWDDTMGASQYEKLYVVQTSSKIIERCLLMTTDPGDLILDPTCGSGTTAYVAEQWGRRWITIDTSRVALSLARTRLMAARYPYYLLADSSEGQQKLRELGRTSPNNTNTTISQAPDIHRGFVYKTVPHITLKSIANNPDIKEGMTREQIDAAIQRHAESETLYDQPYEEKNVVRVCGPFTVESLSPHREVTLPEAPEVPTTSQAREPFNYLQVVLDNLRKAGVKGLDKSERINFQRLDGFPGQYIHAEGVTDNNLGVRVSIGPELGTVGDQWIKAAALEGIKGSKPDFLLICAFSFEASVLEQTAELSKELQFGKLRILPVRMNPDLAMFGDTGQELLKKTGSANLFTVFGEPDLDIKQKDGKYTVTLKGLDVFDPTTGEVRPSSTDDIAVWFIDTDYDGQSFFVRHAYFCGADQPYQRLARALRAEIQETEWEKLYSTTSQPFDPPFNKKIAIKVINHFGDEILKVISLG